MTILLQHTTTHAIMITGFVFMMMLIIEYLNVLSRGVWQRGLRGGQWRQYLLAALLGATPGCLGAFAVVSLFLHKEISLGALVTAMVATSGDESFVMLSLIPQKAPIIFLLLFVIGIAAGYLTDALSGKKKSDRIVSHNAFDVHHQEICHCFPWGNLRNQWKQCSSARGILGCTQLLFLFAVGSGQLGPSTWNWIRITLVILAFVGFFITATVPDHFLEDHLWNHVVKEHLPKIFFWTFGALLVISILTDHLHLEEWIQNNQLIILLIACLVGLIPESGPHLLFLTLFAEGTVPFSIFLASSIIQDGHGMLPLLAESRRDFLKVKAINFAAGILAGFSGYALGW